MWRERATTAVVRFLLAPPAVSLEHARNLFFFEGRRWGDLGFGERLVVPYIQAAAYCQVHVTAVYFEWGGVI